jgi:hypothetical protein
MEKIYPIFLGLFITIILYLYFNYSKKCNIICLQCKKN